MNQKQQIDSWKGALFKGKNIFMLNPEYYINKNANIKTKST